MAASSEKSKIAWGVPLTSQEKKVLGFVLFLAFLGLVMLGWKRWRAEKREAVPATAVPSLSSNVK